MVYPGFTKTCGPITLGFPDEMCMVGTVGVVSIYNKGGGGSRDGIQPSWNSSMWWNMYKRENYF